MSDLIKQSFRKAPKVPQTTSMYIQLATIATTRIITEDAILVFISLICKCIRSYPCIVRQYKLRR